MRSWSLRIGRFFGIDVFVHWTFWILVFWIFLANLGGPDPLRQGLQGALFVLALFVCVVLHEFGHALTARRFGILTKDITLYPIGGISSLESLPEKPQQELLVAIAGPTVNLVIALIIWMSLRASGQAFDISAIENANNVTQVPFFWMLFYANLVLPIFNLIPAFPMDGGRALRSILSMFMNRVAATAVAARIGQFLAIILVFLGLFFNFWLIFIGLFIFLGASGEASFELTKAALAGLKVKDALMHNFTSLAPDSSLSVAAAALLNGQETEFVVIDPEVGPVGFLGTKEIVTGLSEQGSAGQVSEYMDRDILQVSRELPLQDLLKVILEKGRSIAVVVDKGEFEGLIDRQNLEERLLIQQALRNKKR